MLLQDTRLSFDARGFAAWLLALPPNWEIRAEALPYLLKDNSRPGHVGRDKARRFLRELERAGYLTRSRTRNPNGCWIWNNVFTPVPTIDGSAAHGSSIVGSSVGDGPVDIHQTETTTNGLNTDSTNQQPRPRSAIGANAVAGPSSEIHFPEVLSGKHLASARRLIHACSPELRQAVLHEVDAMHRQGLIRKSPVGLLHRLVDSAKAGTFTPSYANSSFRKSHLEERVLVPERRSPGTATGPVALSAFGRETIARMRAMLKEDQKK